MTIRFTSALVSVIEYLPISLDIVSVSVLLNSRLLNRGWFGVNSSRHFVRVCSYENLTGKCEVCEP